MGRPSINLTGRNLGYLTVISRVENNHRGKPMWLVRCDCGVEKHLSSTQLINGDTRSCGCMRSRLITEAKTTHGHALSRNRRSREYRSWLAMRNRCSRPESGSYERYGGRGIKVCDRWENSFDMFLEDMGIAPSAKHTIDRIDPDGDYNPSNCRWASVHEQLDTRRRGLTENDVRYIRMHTELKLRELAEKFGVDLSQISMVRRGKAWKHVL